MSRWWESPRKERSEIPAVSDAAVVLGGLTAPGGSTPDHREFNRSPERITEAVALWKEGRVKAILITSGSGDLMRPNESEAPGLAAWAESMGVPASALVLETKSRNTYENANFSLPLVKDHGFRSLLLVTSAFHMPRSEAIFRKAGYAAEGRTLVTWPVDTQRDGTTFPFNVVPDPNSVMTVQLLIKEMVGYVAYAVKGYL